MSCLRRLPPFSCHHSHFGRTGILEAKNFGANEYLDASEVGVQVHQTHPDCCARSANGSQVAQTSMPVSRRAFASLGVDALQEGANPSRSWH